MANPTKAYLLLNTPLVDRTLWYDGDSSYDPSHLHKLLTQRVQYVTHITPDVAEYNRNVTKDRELRVKHSATLQEPQWNIPEQYAELDVIDYVVRLHMMLFGDSADFDDRERRLVQELCIYQNKQLFDVLRAIIWIINTLTLQDTVWGVGRGSSVSSYVLYVIGVHDVDSYAYELDVEDFLRPDQ